MTTFNQSSLRHCARKARGCHSVVPSSFFEWIPVRKVSGNVLPWFTCTTRWKSSCLTFPTPAFVFNAVCERFTNVDALDFRDLYRFLSKHKFSLPCAYVVAISWFDASQVHKLMRTRTYVNLHFRCLFSCRQVGSIYLMQGEFAESVFFLIPRSWSGAWPNFVYVDNFWKRRKWNGQSLILAYYYAYHHKIIS